MQPFKTEVVLEGLDTRIITNEEGLRKSAIDVTVAVYNAKGIRGKAMSFTESIEVIGGIEKLLRNSDDLNQIIDDVKDKALLLVEYNPRD